jgi:hypothetical protein
MPLSKVKLVTASFSAALTDVTGSKRETKAAKAGNLIMVGP